MTESDGYLERLPSRRKQTVQCHVAGTSAVNIKIPGVASTVQRVRGCSCWVTSPLILEWWTVNIQEFCIVHPGNCVVLCLLWSHLEIPLPLGRHAEAGWENFPAVRENCCRLGRFIFLEWNRIHKEFISCGSADVLVLLFTGGEDRSAPG
jgi:hypothetical protein